MPDNYINKITLPDVGRVILLICDFMLYFGFIQNLKVTYS